MGSSDLILGLAKTLEQNFKDDSKPQRLVCEVKVENGIGVLKIRNQDGKEVAKTSLVVDLLKLDKPFEQLAEEVCKVIADDLKVEYKFQIL